MKKLNPFIIALRLACVLGLGMCFLVGIGFFHAPAIAKGYWIAALFFPLSPQLYVYKVLRHPFKTSMSWDLKTFFYSGRLLFFGSMCFVLGSVSIWAMTLSDDDEKWFFLTLSIMPMLFIYIIYFVCEIISGEEDKSYIE